MISKLVSEEEENILSSEMSVHDNDNEKGTEFGPCPFVVNGITVGLNNHQ